MGLKILLSGSNGFVGRALAQHLSSRGYEVYGLNRNLPTIPSHTVLDYACDIRYREPLSEVIKSQYWDAIIHSAALIDNQNYDLDNYNIDVTTTNTLGTHNVVTEALGNTKHLIYMSSVWVIGTPKEDPITERHPVNPKTIYHYSKYYGELIVDGRPYDGIHGPVTTVLRISPPVGPGMNATKILPTFIRSALNNQPINVLGDGTRVADYIDIRDVARGVEAAIKAKTFGTYNIARGQGISNLDLARICRDHLGSSSPIVFAGKDLQEGKKWNISIERAKTSLQFNPIYNIEHSIDSMVNNAGL